MTVIISGSPRKENSLCRKYAEKIALAAGTEYKIYEAGYWHIDYCTACEKCMETGYCALRSGDDFDRIAEDIRTADAVILASPVYCGNISAQLKTLIDRMVSELHVMSLLGRPAIALAVSEGSYHSEAAEYITKILEYCGASVLSSLAIDNSSRKVENEEALLRAASLLKEALTPGYEPAVSERTRLWFKAQGARYKYLIQLSEFLPECVGEARRWEAQGYMNRSIDDVLKLRYNITT